MTDPNVMRAASAPSDATLERISTFLRRAYGWMGAGLLVTAAVASVTAGSPALVQALYGNPILFFGLIIAQLGLVIWIRNRIDTMGPAMAAGIFLGYAALTGLVFGMIFLAYTATSIGTTFLVTAGMFGALALYGTVTGRNLEGVGQFAYMGLVGLILASIVGLFWHSDTLQFVLMVVGIIVFASLAAYKAQMLKAMALAVDGERAESYAVMGGLSLYLTFINLFLTLLRIFGRRR
jgi:FtsH-binding integral membrane protein